MATPYQRSNRISLAVLTACTTAVLLTALSSGVRAARLVYCGPAFGNWHGSGVWSNDGGTTCTASTPTSSDDVQITGPGVELYFNSSNAVANSLNLTAACTLRGSSSRFLTVQKSLWLDGGSTITVLQRPITIGTDLTVSGPAGVVNLIEARAITVNRDLILEGSTYALLSLWDAPASTAHQSFFVYGTAWQRVGGLGSYADGALMNSTLHVRGFDQTVTEFDVTRSLTATHVVAERAIMSTLTNMTINGRYSAVPNTINNNLEIHAAAVCTPFCMIAVNHTHFLRNANMWIQAPSGGGILNLPRITSDELPWPVPNNDFQIAGGGTHSAGQRPMQLYTRYIDGITLSIANAGPVDWHILAPIIYIPRLVLAPNPTHGVTFFGGDVNCSRLDINTPNGYLVAGEPHRSILTSSVLEIAYATTIRVSGTGRVAFGGVDFVPDTLRIIVGADTAGGVELGVVDGSDGGGFVLEINATRTIPLVGAQPQIWFHANPFDFQTVTFVGAGMEWLWIYPTGSAQTITGRTVVVAYNTSVVADSDGIAAPYDFNPIATFNITGSARFEYANALFLISAIIQSVNATDNDAWLVVSHAAVISCTNTRIRGNLNIYLKTVGITGACPITFVNTGQIVGGPYVHFVGSGNIVLPRYSFAAMTAPGVISVTDVGINGVLDIAVLDADCRPQVSAGVSAGAVFQTTATGSVIRVQSVARASNVSFDLLHTQTFIELLSVSNSSVELTHINIRLVGDNTAMTLAGGIVLSTGSRVMTAGTSGTLRLGPQAVLRNGVTFDKSNPAHLVRLVVYGNATINPPSALQSITIAANAYLSISPVIGPNVITAAGTLDMSGSSGLIALTSASSGGISAPDFILQVTALWRVDLKVASPSTTVTAITYDHVFINASAAAQWLINSAPVPARILFTRNAAYAIGGGIRSQCPYCTPNPRNASLATVYVSSDSNELNTLTAYGSASPYGTTASRVGFDLTNTTAGNATFIFQSCLMLHPFVVIPSSAKRVATLSTGATQQCIYPVSFCGLLQPCDAVGTVGGTGGCIDVLHPNQWYCPCAAGYTGQNCSSVIGAVPPDPCLSSPCGVHASLCTPQNLNSSFVCTCVPPWNGTLCDVDTTPPPTTPADPCLSGPCGAYSTGCVAQNNNSTFQCTCNQYWSGAQCTVWTNPCVPVSPCLFSTDCVTQTNSSTYTCVCNSPECGAGNPDEQTRIDQVIPALVSLTPGISTPMGGQLMTLVTRGFTGSSISIQFGTRPANFNSSSTVFSSRTKLAAGTVLGAPVPFNLSVDTDAPTYMRQLKFRFYSPSYAITASSYRLLVVTAVLDDGSTTILTLESSSLLYYPFNPCLDAGVILQFDSSGVPYCAPCPEGGFCPGGGRVWPIDRYWSRSEFSTPTACAIAEACPGSMGEHAAYPVQTKSDGSRVTTQCAVEYAGDFCGACAENYYRSGARCFSCGASTDTDEQQLQFLIAAAVIIFVLLAIAVATLSSRYLAWIVSGLIALQQFVTIGKSSIQTLPASFSWLVQLIGFLSVINFDVEMVKPGCIVPALSFISLYWTTLILILVFAGLFVLGAAARATWVYHFRLKSLVKVQPAGAEAAVRPSTPPLGPSPARGNGSTAHHNHTGSTSAPTDGGSTGAGGTPQMNGARPTTIVVSPKSEAAVSPTAVVAVSATGDSLPATAGGGDSKIEMFAVRRAGDSPAFARTAPPTAGGSPAGLMSDAETVIPSPRLPAGVRPPPAVDTNVIDASIPHVPNATDERDWAKTWCDVFQARAVQSLLILSSLVFLKVLTLALNCVYCQTYDGTESDETHSEASIRLVADLQIVCYSKEHESAAVFDFFLIVFFGAGFPILSCVLLWRAFRPMTKVLPADNASLTYGVSDTPLQFSARRNDRYGYLYRGLLPIAYYFRLLTFVTNWGFALQSVFARSTAIQLFVPGLFFLVNATGTAFLWPYSNRLNNAISLAVGFGGVLQVMVYLGLLGREESNESDSGTAGTSAVWQFLYYISALTLISAIFILYWRWRKHKLAGTPTAAVAASTATGLGAAASALAVIARASCDWCCPGVDCCR